MKFKVGDIITGKKDNGYCFTTEKSRCVVTSVSSSSKGEIRVKLLSHAEKYIQDCYIGRQFTVEEKEFVLCDTDRDEDRDEFEINITSNI